MKYSVKEYGSEYDWQANEEFFLPSTISQSLVDNAIFYRSGRDAMKAVAIACKEKSNNVLLPALCCESMVSPFTMHGISPIFYRLNSDYTADIEDVKSKLTNDSILVYESYFGCDFFNQEQLSKLRIEYPKAIFLEDRTQDILFRRIKEEFKPDYTVASIRKWTALPDGGLLWNNKATYEQGLSDSKFANLRIEAMKKKSIYLSSGAVEQKECYRQMLGFAADLLDNSINPYVMSKASISILNQLDIDKILAHRQQNVCVLKKLLIPVIQRRKIQIINSNIERSTLYLPILVEDRDYVQKELAKRDIYCPVIWPIPKEAKGVCSIAEYTSAHMLGVPCDHRYTQIDMEYIAEQIMGVIDEK